MDSYPQPAAAPAFDLCGDHPALNYVNSLDKRFGADAPVDLLRDYGDLLRFLEQSQLLEPARARTLARTVSPAAAARALRSARELREAMAAVFYSRVDGRPPRPADIATLERYFHEASRHRELRWEHSVAKGEAHPEMRWQWGRYEKEAELPVWILAQSASQLMLSEGMERVRACGAQNCRWLFFDTSKSHTRRWCNMKVCGNRMKARRFQARHAP